ncbi:MAG: phytoene desaturase, partial [Nitratireductor sp.]|nr:phytoene desaturase [Nitratireductor sp.]
MTVSPSPAGIVAGQDSRPHAVVIGAGFGGLAAAIRLGARGYRVSVLERLEQPGGRAARFRQDGFTFDAGPTIVTAPFVFEELWELCGRRMQDDVTLKRLDPFYTIRFDNGDSFSVNADDDAMKRQIANFNAADIPGYERYLAESERCFQTGFVGMIDKPYSTIGAMLAALPALALRRADRSVHALVGKYIRDERLRMALSFHPLFIGGNPLRASGVLSLISYLEREYGVHYAVGGTHSIIEGMVGLIERQGGSVITNAEVASIDVEDGKARGVTLVSGAPLPARIVVSNADTGWTYSKLLGHIARKRWTDRKIDRSKYSMSLFVWYFGTDR